MTKLGITNYILQWFFIRLTKHQERWFLTFDIDSASVMPNGETSVSGTGEHTIFEWYSIQYWVLPLTGWWSDFIYLNKKPKYIVITKKIEKQET